MCIVDLIITFLTHKLSQTVCSKSSIVSDKKKNGVKAKPVISA